MTIELIINLNPISHIFIHQANGLQVNHVYIPIAHVTIRFLIKREIQEVITILARLVDDFHQHLATESTCYIYEPMIPIRNVADHQRSAFVFSASHLVQMNDVRVLTYRRYGARNKATSLRR